MFFSIIYISIFTFYIIKVHYWIFLQIFNKIGFVLCDLFPKEIVLLFYLINLILNLKNILTELDINITGNIIIIFNYKP